MSKIIPESEKCIAGNQTGEAGLCPGGAASLRRQHLSSDLKEHEEHHSRERRQPERRLQKKEPTAFEKPQKCLCDDSRDSGGEKGERESRGGGEGQLIPLLRAMVKSLLVF